QEYVFDLQEFRRPDGRGYPHKQNAPEPASDNVQQERQAEFSNELLSRLRPQGFITQTITAFEPGGPNVGGIRHDLHGEYHHNAPGSGWKFWPGYQQRHHDERDQNEPPHGRPGTRRSGPKLP